MMNFWESVDYFGGERDIDFFGGGMECGGFGGSGN